jgi:YggT family protein
VNPYVNQFTLTFIQMLTWAIVARSLLSWFPIDQSSPIYQLLFRVTEPLIEPLRRVIPNTGMMDLSPMAAIIVLIVMGQLVAGLPTTS